MKRTTGLLCLLLSLLLNATAQTLQGEKTEKVATISLVGSVGDSFTGAPVNARIVLMQAEDSTVVDTTRAWTWKNRARWAMRVPRREASYLVKAEADGYEDEWMELNLQRLRRFNTFDVPILRMRKKVSREVDLKGVTVNGTRVRMVYRGDTIVYNASAFQLPEGSMLDALVRQLPGAELKGNGDIYVNGRKVDYLTLNGSDFFRGKNKMMLDNLPYYTVQNIKVYDKTSRESRLRGYEATPKDYVMDVSLKRQYNRSYIANLEAGAGTEERYLGRMFGLYFDDRTRVAVFGNVNNVNENRHPGEKGDWEPSNLPSGLKHTSQAGVNLNLTNKDKTLQDGLSASVEWDDTHEESRTSSEEFLNGGGVFGLSERWSRQKELKASLENNLETEGKTSLHWHTAIDFSDGKHDSENRDSTYRPAQLTNQTLAGEHRRQQTLKGETSLDWYQELPWGDYLSLGATLGGNRQRPSESESRQHTRHFGTAASLLSDDHRRYLNDTQEEGYKWSARASYTYSIPNGWNLTAKYSYRQQANNCHNLNYRWGLQQEDNTAQPGGYALDLYNSDLHNCFERSHTGALSLSRNTKKSHFTVELPLRHVSERMHYVEPTLIDTLVRRGDWLFEPTVTFFNWSKPFVWLQYKLTQERPEYVSLMPGEDSTNPLFLPLNNPFLRRSQKHGLILNLSCHNDSTKSNYHVIASANMTHNGWGTRRAYNTLTGQYTTMPDNVDGEWFTFVQVGMSTPLDSTKRWTLENRITPSWHHSVDFATELETPTHEGEPRLWEEWLGEDGATRGRTSPLARVDNFSLEEDLRLNYHWDTLDLTLLGKATWRRAWGDLQQVQSVNTWDWHYGFTARYTIPWVRLTVSTDVTMFQRRGYETSLMNSDDLVWNAELSRSFLHGQLVARLQAFDLLGQLNNRYHSISAQGRSETWNLCLPRYAMLTLQWRLNKTPEKKQP